MFYKFTPLPLPRSNLWNLTAWKLHVSIPYDNVNKSFGQYNYMNQCWIIVNWTISKEIPVSMESKYIILDPRKLFRNRCLQKDGHFVSASVWKRSCVSHNIPNCMKEVTWLKLCLGTNGHRSAALEWLPFILPPVFVQAAVIRSR